MESTDEIVTEDKESTVSGFLSFAFHKKPFFLPFCKTQKNKEDGDYVAELVLRLIYSEKAALKRRLVDAWRIVHPGTFNPAQRSRPLISSCPLFRKWPCELSPPPIRRIRGRILRTGSPQLLRFPGPDGQLAESLPKLRSSFLRCVTSYSLSLSLSLSLEAHLPLPAIF